MTVEAWITLSVVVSLVGLVSLTTLATDIVFVGGVSLLLLLGIISPQEAFAGLSNEGVLTVGVLYIVAAGLRETGCVHFISQRLLGRPKTLMSAQLRLMLPVSLLSAFLNNTPIVAMLIPAVNDWSKRLGLSPSKFLIPLSYAAILGGTCTLIGTSTNLLVHGLLLEQGITGLGMFSLVWVGFPMAVIGLGYILLTSRWLLPERVSIARRFSNPREYSIEMLVQDGGAMVGQTIEGAGLRHLPDVFLAEIQRGERVIPAVSPQEILLGNDRLIFVGQVDGMVDLQRTRGLIPATDEVSRLSVPRPQRVLIEAVVSNTSPLIGQSVKAGRFRTLYNAVVIAVARNGERIKQKIGDIVLHAGDTLLLEAAPSFVEQQRDSRDFFLVSSVDDSHPLRFDRALVALTILAGMVIAVALGWLTMLKASLLAAGLMIITRCCTGSIARKSVDWSVLIVIAAAFGLANAMTVTGAAETLASWVIRGVGQHPFSNLVALYFLTALFTNFMTNNAAAVLMFPIAMALAQSLQVSMMPFAVTIMMAASASFATPLSYQTNLMVYGPGGYRFHDYLKIGLPLTILTACVAVAIIPLIWPF